MASGWHNKLERLLRTDWDEARIRAGQELYKQGDLLRHRLGIRPAAIPVDEKDPSAGKFFFASGEVAERARLLRQHLPEQAAEIVREAEEICAHRFRLLGYENVDYGTGNNNEIDWHLDRVHNKRAPLDPWFMIPFLDFAAVGDHKVTWELNRHQHLVTLAKARLLTNDAKYTHELIAQWRSWIKANPYPLGINWGSTLEVAFRSLSWIWVDHLLAEAPEFAGQGQFRAELLPALAFHGQYIERYLSTYFSPNTHLLGEVLALFFLGTLYPQMPRAERWREQGWKTIAREAARQVRPDGVYFEQALYYHVYALDFFLYARLLASQNGMNIPVAYDERLQRMLDVVEALAQTGPAEGFGDDDGGRLFNPHRNRTEHMTDPLALGALAYDRDIPAAQLTEESIWLFGERATSKFATRTQRGPRSFAFADGGLYVLASGEPCAQTMAIDAGPHGAGRCGHGHADALSVRLTVNGSRWLVDSGSGAYVSRDGNERNVFRGTEAHNSLCVDGVDQAVAGKTFSWTHIPSTRTERWLTGETFTYFAGSHNGYERLPDPVTHRRSVLRVEGGNGVWLIRDVACGATEHDLELNWHFASDLLVRKTGDAEFAASRAGTDGPELHLILPNKFFSVQSFPDPGLPNQVSRDASEWRASITEGRVSPAYGSYETAPILRCAARVRLPAEIATAFLVQAYATPLEHQRSAAHMTSKQDKAVQAYELDADAARHIFLFARDKRVWTFADWSSDAEVLYCCIEHGKLAHFVVIGGSSVEWQGQPVLSAGGPAEFFEWRRPDQLINSRPGSFIVTPVFDELTRTTLGSGVSPVSSFVGKR